MYLVIEIIFWVCVASILHTYFIYPVLLKIVSTSKKQNTNIYKPSDALPYVSIIIAAHNEETVIEEKINSIYNTTYPYDKFEVHIGSDNSTDATNQIIQKHAKTHSNLHVHAFAERQGKAQIINSLAQQSKAEILILTDANVFFEPHTMYELIKHYKNQDIALVGGRIINTNIKKTGISYQEKTYLDNEILIKYREGILWGTMIGAFGGVYSIRKENYHPVPKNYFMDDFYITMCVIQDGKKAITELNATCHEDISNIIQEEFKRKVRISIGNFQNLSSFWKLMLNPFSSKGFSFISHKVLRWITPFLLLLCILCSALLFSKDILYSYLFFIQIGLLLLPIIDVILKSFHIHNAVLRFFTHFYSMNTALFIGFFRFLKGVESNVWQPTKRNQ